MKKSELKNIIKTEILKEYNWRPKPIQKAPPKKPSAFKDEEFSTNFFDTLFRKLPDKNKNMTDSLIRKYVAKAQIHRKSDDTWPVKITSVFKDGTKIDGEQSAPFWYQWRFTINGQKKSDSEVEKFFIDKFMSDTLDQIKYELGRHDWTYEFSDDHGSWSSGDRHKKEIIGLFTKAKSEGRGKEAIQLWKDVTKKIQTNDADKMFKEPFWGSSLKEGSNKISLSEFIELVKDSLKKKPTVKNYDKLKKILPELESMLDQKGNINIPMDQLIKIMQ